MLNEHTLYDYLLHLDRDAEDAFSRLVKQMAEQLTFKEYIDPFTGSEHKKA